MSGIRTSSPGTSGRRWGRRRLRCRNGLSACRSRCFVAFPHVFLRTGLLPGRCRALRGKNCRQVQYRDV